MDPSFLDLRKQILRILLVEDEIADARLIEIALRDNRQQGFHLTHVERLSAATSYLGRAEVDLVILDLGLPDARGLEGVETLSKAFPQIPLIVLTGLQDERVAWEAIQKGAQDYLSKNQVNSELLAHAVCHAIERHHLQYQLSKVREQQLESQKLESLGMLAGGIAHDFNNLLTVILGRAELARLKDRVSPGVEQCLKSIEEASTRAADLCRQLLAYSGKGRFIVQALNVTQILEEMALFLQRSVPQNVVFSYQLGRDLPLVEADASQLRQIVMNLTMNACEAIGSSPGVIALSTGSLRMDQGGVGQGISPIPLPAGSYVYIAVSDNGCGMDDMTRRKIFEPFFSTKSTGRGLGLSAVYGILRSHKGHIEVFTQRGKGSTFRVLLPVVTSSERIQTFGRPSRLDWHGEGSVLVIDDEEGIRNVVSQMVEELGFKVLSAKDGMEGLRLFKEHEGEIMCVLLDMTMPLMSGDEVHQKIRQLRPNARILIMSGYTEVEASQTFGDGLSGFIRKPFRISQLSEKMQGVLGESKSSTLQTAGKR